MVLPNPTFRRVTQEREVDIFTNRFTSPGGMVVSIVKGQAVYVYHNKHENIDEGIHGGLFIRENG